MNDEPKQTEKTDEELLRRSRQVLRLCLSVNPYGTAQNAAAARDAWRVTHNLLDELDKRLG
jgi:hypothetical protein